MCAESYEDLGCGADLSRPTLGCAATGHQSDLCVCAASADTCIAATCAGRCGDVDDGCGGTLSCPATCASGSCGDDGVCVRAVACSDDDCPAFPGAEGFGRNARGGRGGDVCIVSSLDDSGAGTLRSCLSGSGGPRTVVFAVAGIIDLRSPLRSTRDRLTVAGQTAPGDGVTVRGFNVELKGDNVIVQHLRFRAGDIRKKTRDRPEGFTEDSLTVAGEDVIVDHVSASWGIDENLSAGPDAFRRVTVQWSIIAEGLHRTGLFHGELDPDHNGHSMGSLFKSRSGDSSISIHHNLFANNNNRNPAIGNYARSQSFDADIRNNVLFNNTNSGYTSGESGRVRVNYVGNVHQFGPISRDRHAFEANSASQVQAWQSENLRDLRSDGSFQGSDDGWQILAGDYDRESGPFAFPAVTTHRAADAYGLVLNEAGARPWSRDSVDVRIVDGVRRGQGRLINSQNDVGAWGTLAAGQVPVDGDRDGMPDAWEREAGTNPNRADHNGDVDGDGYTNLEGYLHALSAQR